MALLEVYPSLNLISFALLFFEESYLSHRIRGHICGEPILEIESYPHKSGNFYH